MTTTSRHPSYIFSSSQGEWAPEGYESGHRCKYESGMRQRYEKGHETGGIGQGVGAQA